MPAAHLPLGEAMPFLARAWAAPGVHRAVTFWGAATMTALGFVARGLLLRHVVPLDDGPPLRLPDPERLLRAFKDGVADTLPRSPADAAAGHGVGVQVSLRIEVSKLSTSSPEEAAPAFRVLPQVHGVSDPTLVADAAEVGRERGPAHRGFDPWAHAACAWPALTPLLSADVPDAVELHDEEVADIPGKGTRAPAGAGVDAHWAKEPARTPTAHAVVTPPEDGESRDSPVPDCRRSCPLTLLLLALHAGRQGHHSREAGRSRRNPSPVGVTARPVGPGSRSFPPNDRRPCVSD
ncbi:hypothetical protein [Streptomyces sp. NPDC101166]|uniref:hypothetical protein n=1 Tax=Streptomyces sp. NPDC101166 TaxID=3366120 RepID=UPI00382D1975